MISLLNSAVATVDEFNQWLEDSEKKLSDDVIDFKVLELQAIVDKRKELEVGEIFTARSL